MGHADGMSRRGFLGAVGSGFAAAMVGENSANGFAAAVAQQDDDTSDLYEIFKNIPMDDQTTVKDEDASFNIPKQFGKGQCLILFGFNGCPRCSEITKTLIHTQEKMIKQKAVIPIIVVSTNPAGKDGDRKHVQEYIQRYEDYQAPDYKGRGVKETVGGKTVLHIALPESAGAAQQIQQRLFAQNQAAHEKNSAITEMHGSGLARGKNAPHTPYLTLFENGEMKQVFRGINPVDDKSSDSFAARTANDIVSTIKSNQVSASR
jgi:hypothetical protein